MKNSGLGKIAGVSLLSAGLIACGGGGGTSDSGTTGGGTQTTLGAVTGFGSVFVNGVEFETDGSTITIEGQPAAESDLAVGMMVTVRGSHDGSRGNAVEIHADDELEGVVLSNSVDPTTQTGEMNVMGQAVQVKATTSFESYVSGVNSVDQVAAGNVVEVSGYSDGNGLVIATRIELKAEDLNGYFSEHEYIELKGLVADLDSVDPAYPMAFRIGTLIVDYSGAIIDDDTTLANGLYVEVKSQQPIVDGVLTASKVEREDDGKMGFHDDDGDDRHEVEVKGAITTAFDGDSFAVNGTVFVITSNTELDDIGTDQLTVGTIVEVEGRYNSEGTLVAHEIEREDEAEDEREGTIAEIDVTGTNTGTIRLEDGTIIHVDNDTIMKDERDDGMMPVKQFNLTHLAIGDFIEVYVVPVGTDGYRAVKLERDDDDYNDDSSDDDSDDGSSDGLDDDQL